MNDSMMITGKLLGIIGRKMQWLGDLKILSWSTSVEWASKKHHSSPMFNNVHQGELHPQVAKSIGKSYSFSSLSGWWFGCHLDYFPINIGFLIIPIDEVIFFRGVAHPPTSYPWNMDGFCWSIDDQRWRHDIMRVGPRHHHQPWHTDVLWRLKWRGKKIHGAAWGVKKVVYLLRRGKQRLVIHRWASSRWHFIKLGSKIPWLSGSHGGVAPYW